MNRQSWIVLGAMLGVILLAVLMSWWLSSPEDTPVDVVDPIEGTADPTLEPTPEETAAPTPTAEYTVYFPGSDGRLHGETRELPAELSPADRLTAIADLLVKGPLTEGLWPPLPAGTRLAHTYLLDDGRAILDFEPPPIVEESEEPGPPPQMGARQELLLAYSLANSVLLNLEEATGLIVLWKGEQPVTLAGQLDTTRPLLAETDWIAPES